MNNNEGFTGRFSKKKRQKIEQFFFVFLIKSTNKSFTIVYNFIVEKDLKICKGN